MPEGNPAGYGRLQKLSEEIAKRKGDVGNKSGRKTYRNVKVRQMAARERAGSKGIGEVLKPILKPEGGKPKGLGVAELIKGKPAGVGGKGIGETVKGLRPSGVTGTVRLGGKKKGKPDFRKAAAKGRGRPILTEMGKD